MKTIVVAGATGNLGGRIAKALLAREAHVVALVRKESAKEKIAGLEALGIRIADDAAQACAGASCVVSVMQGLRDTIVDAQSALAEAAAKAGVKRFVSSDFSTDFRPLPRGENRNFDLRREALERLEGKAIATTSIFSGAFAEILGYGTPLLDREKKTVAFWADADWSLDFTTMDDTAAYTAAAALDDTTPRALHIASFQVTPRELMKAASEAFEAEFALVDRGSLAGLGAHNARERAAHPAGESEVFPTWQRTQYIHSMFSTHHENLDNARYPDLRWTDLRDVLRTLRR